MLEAKYLSNLLVLSVSHFRRCVYSFQKNCFGVMSVSQGMCFTYPTNIFSLRLTVCMTYIQHIADKIGV